MASLNFDSSFCCAVNILSVLVDVLLDACGGSFDMSSVALCKAVSTMLALFALLCQFCQ